MNLLPPTCPQVKLMAMYGHGDVMKEEADDLLKLFRIAKKVSCRGREAMGWCGSHSPPPLMRFSILFGEGLGEDFVFFRFLLRTTASLCMCSVRGPGHHACTHPCSFSM